MLVVALAGAGILGTAINQRAYQIAPLAFSMPVVNVVGVLVAIVFGAFVFGEVPGHSPGGMVVQLLGLGVLAVGPARDRAARPDCRGTRPHAAGLPGRGRTMSITYVVILALLTGTHAATWGAFKDSPFEGFKPVSFARTIVLAVLAAAVAGDWRPISRRRWHRSCSWA